MNFLKLKRELNKRITNLERRYCKEYTGRRLDYAQEELINIQLNYLKSLEYHYRDDVERKPRAKKNIDNHKEYNEAMEFFDKIAEQIDDGKLYSDYKLKSSKL